jgi:hypothetical protein
VHKYALKKLTFVQGEYALVINVLTRTGQRHLRESALRSSNPKNSTIRARCNIGLFWFPLLKRRIRDSHGQDICETSYEHQKLTRLALWENIQAAGFLRLSLGQHRSHDREFLSSSPGNDASTLVEYLENQTGTYLIPLSNPSA